MKTSEDLNPAKSIGSGGIRNRWLLVVLLVLVYVVAVFFRIEYGQNYRGRLFTSESALRLYYAGLVSEGKSLPKVDYKAQYPEGLEFISRNPVLMEYVTGYSHKLLGLRMPFVDFVRLFIPIISSLSIFAVYLVTRELTGNRIAGLISALFYAVALPAVSRACGWEFIHETLALPLIFFHIYFFLKGIRRNKLFYAALSGICIALALAAWKISQLYFLLLVVFIALNLLFNKRSAAWVKNFSFIVIFVVFAGVIVPFLRQGLFLTSYSMVISYAVCVAAFFKQESLKGRVKARFIFFIILILLLLILPRSERFSHTYGLMIYKLRFLGQKPADPSLLPFEVRALWADPLTSPSLFELIYYFFPLLLLGAGTVIYSFLKFLRRKIDTGELFIAYNAVVFLLVYLLVRRLRVFFIYFLVVLAGYLVMILMRSSKKYLRIGLPLILLCLVIEWGKTSGYGGRNIFIRGIQALGIREKAQYFQTRTFADSFGGLIDWIENNTGENEVFLTHYHISPMIRAYANRGVNLVSLFESKPLREKIEEFIYALFGDEKNLHDLCRRFKADYLVYTIDTIIDESANSWRYLADCPVLNEGMVAYRMHFSPDTLENFELSYENEFFRVYRAVEEKGEKAPGSDFITPPLIYQAALFKEFSGSTSRFQKRIEEIYSLYLLGSRFLSTGRYGKAGEVYETVLELAPDFPEAHAGLGAVYENTGDREKALRCYNEYLRLSPRGGFSEEIRKRILLLNFKKINHRELRKKDKTTENTE